MVESRNKKWLFAAPVLVLGMGAVPGYFLGWIAILPWGIIALLFLGLAIYSNLSRAKK